MKKITQTFGKTATAIGLFLAIVTGIITCWQFYKSSTRHNLAGAWKLKFVNEASSMRKYIGETHTQKVFFCQNDGTITGNGEKWEYNGSLLPFDQHRKLEYVGNIENDCLTATFKLYGLLRESSGSIDVTLTADGKKMIGRFMGTAGDTKGTVEGEKLED